ncbi:MAG: nucleotidyltransferase domain-containing protein [Bacteroidetes bacterium]|nr:MAG: nucleotidyltransferase domain-containing protein [Bacteroidota bacterium]
MVENTYIQQIKAKLSEMDPYLILLFGSYANGTPNDDSDIDLIVVTNDKFIPKNFTEKNKIFLRVSRKIRHINLQIAIDLLVYTIPMYENFIKQNSSFAQEILEKGKVIYERHNKTMD